MKRDQVIDLILSRCGKRNGDTFLQQAIVNEMVMAQQSELEGADFKPWWLLSEFMHANCGINESRLPLPTGFLEEHEEGLLWVLPPGTTKWQKVVRDDFDDLEERFGNATGIPRYYAVVRQYIIMFPTPDLAYPMRMRAYLREPTLDFPYGTTPANGVVTNQWLTEVPDWIIGVVGQKIATIYLKDKATGDEFAAEAAKARARLYVAHVAREEMNRERSAGDD